ncbi:hypothetical protein SPBR_06246 [Sporothrix brasiliensis 5110]|uniref:Uncharacterized protein n=1 Tax=Sporothrix brasiliensis 5110 TaxID=1398154 RepID=A0A0C2IYR6_9PEZI|nr:uncharacterized protein SPBR_06246 [Sporothrix brasiliensis 5110]KIH94246.1 hypothetical protein SPBR_06246 [Sporothrix brasiliensis 5110]
MSRRTPPRLYPTRSEGQRARPPTPYPFTYEDSLSCFADDCSRGIAYDWIRNHVRYVRPDARLFSSAARGRLLYRYGVVSQNNKIHRRPISGQQVPKQQVPKQQVPKHQDKRVAFILPGRRPLPSPVRPAAKPACPSPSELVQSMNKLKLAEDGGDLDMDNN